VPLAAVIAGGLPTNLALGCGVVVDLPPVGCAAITVGLCMGLMPLVPAAALKWARLAPAPVPTTADDLAADTQTVDAERVERMTRRAVEQVTAMIQGLSWPGLVAGAVLAFSQDVTAQLLTGFAAAALLLRARLFATVGQRLPLLLAGIGSTAALLLAVPMDRVGTPESWWSGVPAVAASVACLWLANRHRRPSPSATRTAEIADLIIATAIIPLVFGVLGVFGFVRGLGG
jgi:type VII secretion integral membrane protein EccD